MSPFASRVRSVTRGISPLAFLLLIRVSPSLSELALTESMHVAGDLTYALAYLVVFKPMKALLTPNFTDCNCALSVQGHRQLWPLHEHGSVDQPR